MTCTETAQAMGVSVTKISRMETGERGLYVDEVAALLGLYRVPATLRQELLDLVRNGGDPNWWQTKRTDLPTELRDLIRLGSDATAIANFEPIAIPGLLQTAEYAAAWIRGILDEPQDSQVSALVATRMARQSVLAGRNAPSLHVIIDEMALHRPIGSPGVMRRQLQHLLASAQRPNVTVQAVPISVGATTALEGPMVLIDLIDGSSVVHLETRLASGFLSEDLHLRAARIDWRRICSAALAPDKSARLIATIAGKMPDEGDA